ncbi:MAG TPA: hypothetical protein VFP84_33990 [Kofleriaceae bacterium]|nr:hypothetical protein [Kofleriaceae bacterium]
MSFDEERLFAFGEQIGSVPSFTGEQAMTWGPGYAWDELAPLLAALLDEGILARGDGHEERAGGLVDSPLPPSKCPVAKFFSNDTCEDLTRELSGHAVEMGNLEIAIAMHRIAHAALDTDDRQVGEGNVYPPGLRLDRDTEWRVCQYPGSRYRDALPMNVTALKAMIKYWRPILATILHVRREMLARMGEPARPPWTIGELHTFSSVVLALPTFLLMQRGGSQPQVALDPVLSSMFRITDGIRMTTYDMMFSIEHTLDVNLAVDGAGIYEYAEKYAALIGTTGVCAGPEPMIREFLSIVIDGSNNEQLADRELPPQVQHLLTQLPAAVDYGLYSMQVAALTSTIWLQMSEATEAVLAVLASDAAAADPRCVRLRNALLGDWQQLETLQHTRTYDRNVHWIAFRDAYARSHAIARTSIGPAELDAAVAPVAHGALHDRAADELRGLLASYPASIVEPMIDIVLGYLRREQAMLAHAAELQAQINRVLDRPAARRPPAMPDLLSAMSYGARKTWFPHLFATLARGLGISITHTATTIDITARNPDLPPDLSSTRSNSTRDHASDAPAH